jgi:hypothetical protein
LDQRTSVAREAPVEIASQVLAGWLSFAAKKPSSAAKKIVVAGGRSGWAARRLLAICEAAAFI